MTKITKLVLEGFKSFGKHTELYFGDTYNCVLGPNGSGKSNIGDALCFVLGKTSAKSLRAEKSANLIYNGGKTKNPAKAAEVSIFFDNEKKSFPLEEHPIKVTRIVKQNGQSLYKINGKTRTRQEIVELLDSAKIDPDGYNIILQGDIVRLVEMSTIERRQIIEEISGIGLYEEKKTKALNELTKVDEKINQSQIILKERESYLKDLKKDRDHALKYKQLSDNVKQNKATYLHIQLTRKEEEKQKTTQKSDKHRTKLSVLQEQLAKNRQSIKDKKEELQKISKEIEEKGEIEQVTLQKSIEQLKVDMATHKTNMSNATIEIARLNSRKQQLGKNSEDVDEKIKEFKEKITEKDEEKRLSENELKELEKKIDEFKKKHKLGDESEKIETRIEELDKAIEEEQKNIQEQREKQQTLLREKDKIEFQIGIVDEQINKVLELEKEHKNEIEAIKQKKKEFKKAVLELNELLNKDSQSAATLAQVRTQLLKLQEDASRLELKKASVQDYLSTNIAIKNILDNKKQIGDIRGTISELGQTDQKYSLALEVAAGNKIYSIVVGDDKTGEKAINYLKRQQLGTATFLPLNKIKGGGIDAETRKLLDKPGVHGLAVDLIKHSPEYKNAFNYVFGSTIVVDDIAIARKIGIGAAKMVTLEGDKADISGAMIGGFRRKKTGSFKDVSVDKEIDNNNERTQGFLQKQKQLEKEREENEHHITRLRELKANLEGDIIKSEKILHLDGGDLEASKTYKEDLKKKLQEAEQQLRDINNDLMTKNRHLTDIKIEKQNLRGQINELRKPTILAELNSYEQLKKDLFQKIVELIAEIKGLHTQLNEVHSKEKDNIIKVLKEIDKETKKFEELKKDLNNQIQIIDKNLKEKEKIQAKAQTQFKELFEKSNKLNEQINEIETKSFSVDEDAKKEEIQLNTFSIEEAKINAEIAGVRTEFEQYEGIELLKNKDEEALKKEIKEFERMLSTIGSVNLKALEIFEVVEKEYHSLVEKKEKLAQEKNDVLILINEIEGQKKGIFMTTLAEIEKNFSGIFSQLTTKGEAHLELENPENIFAEGLQIKVRLTGNKFLDIRGLSGGEKTLTALAFLFAIQEHEPASFYILDEVDAALDKRNADKLAKLIREYCKKAQYIVITHNDAVISEADILYGVSMDEHGISKVVSLQV